MPHFHPGLLLVLGPICLALAILLTIEILLIRPANRVDNSVEPHGFQPDAAPHSNADWAPPPHLIYTATRNRAGIGGDPARPC